MKTVRRFGIAATLGATLALIGCGRENPKPVEVKGGSQGMAERMANDPNLSPEQREKIRQGMQKQQGGQQGAPSGGQ